MKNVRRIMCLTLCLFIFSCDDSVDETQEDVILMSKNLEQLNYIEYQDALDISNQLISESMEYLENLEYREQSESEIKNEFYNQSTVLTNLSNVLEYDTEIVPDNYNQFDIQIEISDINNSEFLNEIQKDYASNLLNAVEQNNFDELIRIKDSFKNDVVSNPELRIFNSGIALIESAQMYMNSNGDYSYTTFGDDDCLHATLVGGVMGGVYGMISGAIGGGLSGVTLGFIFTGGILSVPAGGAGAVAGATSGGFLGFLGGAILGYLGCLIFG
ncbi:hypothetical protein [Flavobacterium sp. CS20]|uniref:hypothetical protein n=1 Tax=Flavobacterium sp. CS20 TaxID=2775246 RepID=UPI001B3A5510|nr:hypothetical protein [Flavobacterium sp. CS20]QTY27914.1 hypothetical protein IGB25_05265 [Flavobacterium sp. CS20]